jgi:diketogulonate reductase-like aldo/keto reductase
MVAHQRHYFLPRRCEEHLRQHGKSVAQVMLRWHLRQGRSVTPEAFGRDIPEA